MSRKLGQYYAQVGRRGNHLKKESAMSTEAKSNHLSFLSQSRRLLLYAPGQKHHRSMGRKGTLLVLCRSMGLALACRVMHNDRGRVNGQKVRERNTQARERVSRVCVDSKLGWRRVDLPLDWPRPWVTLQSTTPTHKHRWGPPSISKDHLTEVPAPL